MAKTSQKDLDALMAASIENPGMETLFFRALLDADVYVHAPAQPTGPNLKLVTFVAPEGIRVIPVFTDRKKAEFASSRLVRIIKLTGRQLFESAPGATFMLNPNDRRCTLYPEEIRALLAHGQMARFSTETLQQDIKIAVTPPTDVPPGFEDIATRVLSTFPGVLRAYLCEFRQETALDHPWLVIAVLGRDLDEQRVGRALATAIQTGDTRVEATVDLYFLKEGGATPDWLADGTILPFYPAPDAPQSTVHGDRGTAG